MSSFFQRGILHKISSTVEFLTFTVSFFIYIMTKDWLETISYKLSVLYAAKLNVFNKYFT